MHSIACRRARRSCRLTARPAARHRRSRPVRRGGRLVPARAPRAPRRSRTSKSQASAHGCSSYRPPGGRFGRSINRRKPPLFGSRTWGGGKGSAHQPNCSLFSIDCGNGWPCLRGHLQNSSCAFKRGTSGEMAEWLKAHAWKACVRETVPWVRIPLSPPAWLKPCILCPNLLAIKPSSSSDFSFELRTSNRQSLLILLRMAHLSPELWTLPIRYGSRNYNV